jgi:hypothetical protein
MAAPLLEVPQPTVPASPAVPEAPVVPSVPSPAPEVQPGESDPPRETPIEPPGQPQTA